MLKKSITFIMALVLVISGLNYMPKTEVKAATSAEGSSNWNLVWSDEFNQTVGGAPSSSNWSYDQGQTGWGNNELQNYTNSTDNVYIADLSGDSGSNDGKGLAIKAKKSGSSYTSGRIHSQNKQYIRYGRVECKMKVEKGSQSGVWPAFWMLGENYDPSASNWDGATGNSPWPSCGEIDIMEHRNTETNVIGTLHWNTSNTFSSHVYAGSETNNQYGAIDTIENWHTYALEWYSDVMKFFVDGKCFETIDVTDSQMDEFTRSHFILFNLALGSTSSPFTKGETVSSSFTDATMLVDYVRVYQGTGSEFSYNEADEVVTTNPSLPTTVAGLVANINDLKTNYTFAWNSSTGKNATSYNLYIDDNTSPTCTVYNGQAKSISELGWSAGETHTVYVTAVNDIGESAKSNGAQITVPSITTTTIAEGSTTAAANIDPSTIADEDWANVLNSSNVKYYIPTSSTGKVTVKPQLESNNIYMAFSMAAVFKSVTINGVSKEVSDGAYYRLQNSDISEDGYYTLVATNYYESETATIIFKVGNPTSSDTTTVAPTQETTTNTQVTTTSSQSTEGTELLKGTDFSSSGSANWVEYGGTYTNNGDGSVSIDVPAYSSGSNWETQLKQNNISLTSGKWYRAKFTVSSNVAKKVQFLMQYNNVWTTYASEIKQVPANGSVNFDVVFQGTETISDGMFGIMMGYVDGTSSDAAKLKINNLSFKEYNSDPTKIEETTTEKPTEAPTTVVPTTTQAPTTVAPTTTEAPTTEAPTTTEESTTTIISSQNVKIEGFQISTTYEGTRVVGSFEPTINGKSVTKWGFVYGLNSIDGETTGILDSDMTIDSVSEFIKAYESTAEGTMDVQMGDSSTATYYVRTMKFGGTTSKAFSASYKVRAYAILSDGSCIYSDISDYNIFDIADYLYKNILMNSFDAHTYLYTNILSKVNDKYEAIDYNWNNSVVKPGEITE